MISFLTLSSKNYAIWLIFECARAKTARKSWDLLHRSCWVALEIHTLRTSPRMEVPLDYSWLSLLCYRVLFAIYIPNWSYSNPFFLDFRYINQDILDLEIVGEWVMIRRPFWIKIMHISPILLGRFCDKKSWKLLSVLCSLWGIYVWENLQCVFSLQTLQCAMFWFSLKLA